MKFWTYTIDWRSMAVNIIAETTNKRMAEEASDKHLIGMSPDELIEFAKFKTLGCTPVCPEMEAAVVPFRHKGQAIV